MKNEKIEQIGFGLKKGEWYYFYSDGSEKKAPPDTEIKGPTLNNSWGKISAMLKDRLELLAAAEDVIYDFDCQIHGGIAHNCLKHMSDFRAAVKKAKGE